MRIPRMLQTVTCLLVVIVATGCAATKEYSSKLFAPRDEAVKDSQAVAIRFLELDKLESKEDWVDTKVIKDSVWKDPVSGAGDALAKQSPQNETKPKKATGETKKAEKPETETEIETDPIVRTTPVNGTRNKSSRE